MPQFNILVLWMTLKFCWFAEHQLLTLQAHPQTCSNMEHKRLFFLKPCDLRLNYIVSAEFIENQVMIATEQLQIL